MSEDDWRPIETAPKDDRKILAYFPDDEGCLMVSLNWRGEYALNPDGAEAFAYEIIGLPTHWMPLPNPPKA